MSVSEVSRGNDGHADLLDIVAGSATRTPQPQVRVTPDSTCLEAEDGDRYLGR
jgi:hypothetical protein